MATGKTKLIREVPNQSYSRIKRNILSKRKSNSALTESDLFRDPSFPPDLSSLTYVYSGDDRYEKMRFKRPPEIIGNASFFGVGGVLYTPFPWKQFRKRKWLEAAAVVISLCVRYLEKVIPGYRVCEQSFSVDYVGAFRFNLWRFGDWVEVIVDDNLPVFGNDLVYCSAFGDPPEFWSALLEKAYAKLMQTYEAIECGSTLDALTDFTGGVCEYYSPDINPPKHLFHILYKSYSYRSLMVCWRNDKRLTPTGFHHFKDDGETDENRDDQVRFLHIITAVTKFPTSDGRLLEFVRLKCPFPMEPRWHGKYSDSDTRSWELLNTSSKDKYRPLLSKDADEYWMLLEDFCCNFGGLFICSGREPFRVEGFSVERAFSFHNKDFDRDLDNNYNSDKILHGRYSACLPKSKIDYCEPVFSERNNKTERIRTEGQKTTKVERAFQRPSSAGKCLAFESYDSGDRLVKYLLQKRNSCDPFQGDQMFTRLRRSPYVSNNKIENYERIDTDVSMSSESGSTYSTSDISVHVPEDYLRQNSWTMQRNNPFVDLPRKHSTGSISHLTQSNFLATKIDNFRCHGTWKFYAEQHDMWTKSMSPGSREDMSRHSKNPRIHFTVIKPQSIGQPVSQTFRGKVHMIISLLQDYRQGPSTANSLLVPIGFCIYKTKYPDKDDKRSLSKLQLIDQIQSKGDMREVNCRLNLEEGHYFVVPYCMTRGHEANFLLRVLGENDSESAKSGCAMS